MLNQSEIDALLSGTIEMDTKGAEGGINLAEMLDEGTDEVPRSREKIIRNYNFWSPDRFSKDHIRALEMIHEELAEMLISSQPTFLRTEFRPRVVHVEQGRFDPFLRELPDSTQYQLLSFTTLPGKAIMVISENISKLLLEFQLGGDGERRDDDHEMTDIDNSILRGIIENMFNDLKSAWSKVANIEPRLEDSTDNQRWIQMVIGNERVVSVIFEVTVQDVTGSMHMFIPYSTIKPIAKYLSPHILISGKQKEEEDIVARQMIMSNMLKVEVPIKAQLGSTMMKIEDIISLQVGDVIKLDSDVSKDISLFVGQSQKFSAQLGKIGNKIAALITRIIGND